MSNEWRREAMSNEWRVR